MGGQGELGEETDLGGEGDLGEKGDLGGGKGLGSRDIGHWGGEVGLEVEWVFGFNN